jgi:hypothetical protein
VENCFVDIPVKRDEYYFVMVLLRPAQEQDRESRLEFYTKLKVGRGRRRGRERRGEGKRGEGQERGELK